MSLSCVAGLRDCPLKPLSVGVCLSLRICFVWENHLHPAPPIKKYHPYPLGQACWARRAILWLFPGLPSHPLQTLARQHFRTANHEWILVVLQLLYRWTAAAGKPVMLGLQRHIHSTGNRKCMLVIEHHLCRSSTRFLFTQLYVRISHVCVLLLLFTAKGNMGGCRCDLVSCRLNNTHLQ